MVWQCTSLASKTFTPVCGQMNVFYCLNVLQRLQLVLVHRFGAGVWACLTGIVLDRSPDQLVHDIFQGICMTPAVVMILPLSPRMMTKVCPSILS